MKKNLLKIIAVASVFSFVAFILHNSFVPTTKADGDEVLKEIAKYKSWTKITKDPVEVSISNAAISGWISIGVLSSLEWGKNTTAVPQVITRGTNTRIIMPSRGSSSSAAPKKKEKPGNPHKADGTTFGVVYANDLAKAEIEKSEPVFPVGSIIVREKRLSMESELPEIVIAMVKREKGFSKKTGDWEFFTLDSKAEIATRRETKGNCASCHANAKETDWVFRDYLR